MKRNRILALTTVLVLALASAGCGLFDTAQPQPPTDTDALPPDFTLPESTLATFARSVTGRNASNFGLCYADTANEQKGFHASFDPADIQDYLLTHPSPPDDWTRAQELTFFNQFIGSITGNAVLFFLPDPRPDGPNDANRVIWNRRYRVYSGPSAVAAGSAGLHIERVNLLGEWKITYWEDRRDTTSVLSWGTRRLNGR